jgi:hypothetical protein
MDSLFSHSRLYEMHHNLLSLSEGYKPGENHAETHPHPHSSFALVTLAFIRSYPYPYLLVCDAALLGRVLKLLHALSSNQVR